MKIFPLLIAIGTASLGLVSVGHAQTILFNFGGKTYTGTNSPGHFVGATTGTNWEAVAVDTTLGDIQDQDGNATSVVLDFGTAIGTTGDYSAATRAADYPTLSATGIFHTELGASNAVRDTGGNIGIILNISGLAHGSYEFYLTTFRGDGSSNYEKEYQLYGGAAADPITDFSSLSLGSLNNSTRSEWIEGVNYYKGSFQIDETNDNFSILSISPATPEFIGVLTSLEIVQIPEPSSAILLGLAGAGLLFIRRRSTK